MQVKYIHVLVNNRHNSDIHIEENELQFDVYVRLNLPRKQVNRNKN